MNHSTRACVIVGVYLLTHLIFARWQPLSLWGADMLAYASPPGWIGFTVLSLILIVPGSRRGLERGASRLGQTAGTIPGHEILIPIFLTAAAVGLFILFRSATHLLGDGYLYLREMDTNLWYRGPRTDRAPLTFFLIRGLQGMELWKDGETTYRVYSTVSGALFVAGSILVSKRMGKTQLESTILAGSLLTAGLMQVFFGYVENYAFHLVVFLAYIYTAFISTRNKVPPWLAAGALGILITLHFAYLFLVPSLFLLAFLSAPADRSLRNIKTWISAITVSVGALALGTVILQVIGFDHLAFFLQDQGSHLLPLLDEPNYRQHYRLFSLNHFLDLINLLFLVAPVVFLVPMITGWRKPQGFSWFLIASAASGFLFAFLANPEIGIFRDWDVLAFGALPLILATGFLLIRAIPDPGQLAPVAVLVLGAAFLHTTAWVTVNASADRSTARFEHILQTAPLSDHALSYGWESLGSHYFENGDDEASTRAYLRASGATPGNPRHWMSLGSIQLKAGNFDGAMAHYQKALSLAPNRGDVHRRIGELLLNKKDLPAAEVSLKKAVELSPGDAVAHVLLGTVYMTQKQYPKARQEYETAITLNPRSVEAQSNLASALYGAGDFQGAIARAEQALLLNPDQSAALYILGACYWRMNQMDKGAVYLQRFLEVDPENTNAPAVRRILGQ